MSRIHTAVLIDLENLIDGYARAEKAARELSLDRVIQGLRAREEIRGIATLRAYANWSDPRLQGFRREVNRIGIEPVQVFGLGWNGAKNVADIQLAVDAIDLAHIRPNIDTFVIVSGDGGFSGVAKKLREYGKVVIGAAYRDAANPVLPALCDAFHWIDRPAQGANANGGSAGQGGSSGNRATYADPLSASWEPAEGVDKMREVLHAFAASHKADLAEGMHMNLIQAAIAAAIPGFQPKRFGFVKFTDLLVQCCTTTKLAVVRDPGGVPRVALRDSPPTGTTIMEPEPPPEPHSEAHYRKILTAGKPYLSLPNVPVLRSVAEALCASPPQGQHIEALADTISAQPGFEGQRGPVRTALRLLAFLDLLESDDTDSPAASRPLRLAPSASTPRAICDAVYAAALEKVSGVVEDVDAAVLRGMVDEGGGEA